MKALLLFAAILIACARAQSSTSDQVYANYNWYCVAWQNAYGTTVAPSQLYSLAQLSSDSDGNPFIAVWYGDAPQPALSDLETISPSAAATTQFQYTALQQLEQLQMLTVTAAQRAQLILVTAGMQIFNTDTGAINIYTGSAWKVVTAT
jgi:hypothetical protein